MLIWYACDILQDHLHAKNNIKIKFSKPLSYRSDCLHWTFEHSIIFNTALCFNSYVDFSKLELIYKSQITEYIFVAEIKSYFFSIIYLKYEQQKNV